MMKVALKVATPPAVEPVSVEEAKLHLRVVTSADDTLITELIKAARYQVEAFLWRALITQTWDLVLDAFPTADRIAIPMPPLASMASITYTDEANVSTVMSSADYIVDTYSEPGQIVLGVGKSWPSAVLKPVNGVVIRFVCGYGLAVAVPEWAKAAIKLIVGDLYENREQTIVGTGIVTANLSTGVQALLWPHRIVRL